MTPCIYWLSGSYTPRIAKVGLVAHNIYADIFEGVRETYHPKVLGEVVSLGRHLAVGWLALPFLKKITFVGFLGSLLKTAVQEKHVFLLKKESRNWIPY